MNEDERRRVYKAKRKRQKKRRKERKKEEAKQARIADRQRRIQQEAERIVQTRIDQGELVVSQKERNATRAAPTGPEVENPVSKDSGNKRRCTTQQQEGPPKKTVRRQSHQHALKEISSDQIRRTAVHLGSGSYGSCYLALYRGIRVVVKELRVKQLQLESRGEAEARVVRELIYEARILNKLGDHPSLPLLFGVCSERTPYHLIMQFHGNQDGTSFTISTALSKKRITKKITWIRIIAKAAGALARIHEKGFLHNDLKSNNVVLDDRDGVYNPVIIDFGKSVPISGARGPKTLSAERQTQYAREFPHIAPEIVGGVKGQSTASDVFSLAKIGETIFRKAELGRLPLILVKALNTDPTKRPGLDKIASELV